MGMDSDWPCARGLWWGRRHPNATDCRDRNGHDLAAPVTNRRRDGYGDGLASNHPGDGTGPRRTRHHADGHATLGDHRARGRTGAADSDPCTGDGGTPVATATRAPAAAQTSAPQPAGIPGNIYNCPDFASQAAAQAYLRQYPSRCRVE